jgi:hypothetical protein
MKKTYLLISGIFLIIFVSTILSLQHSAATSSLRPATSAQSVSQSQNYISHMGSDGKTAQELLMAKEKGKVGFNASGMVTTINNRIADTKKHEYWAFYVNGKMSTVGAASYVTTRTDKLEWKIETY